MPGSNIQNPGSTIQEEVTERGVQKFSALKKNRGGNAVKKNRVPTFCGLFVCFFPALEKSESTKSWDSNFFHSIFPPCLGLFFFRAKIFGLLSPSLPLVWWRQGFGYCFLACNGIMICNRRNFFKTLFQKKSNLLHTYTITIPRYSVYL